MADNGESSASAGTKAIGSLARKRSDVTRQGAQKLKFVPTLPARRKKEEVQQELPQPSVQLSDKGNGRGRGRGRGRGGEGRGAAPPRPSPVEMTASGPFAMGPTLAGTSARRSTPRSTFAPVVPPGPAKGSALGANLSAASTLKKEKQRENPLGKSEETLKDESDEEIYSEPDEGVEIIDMERVRQLDWMAPETLQRERRRKDIKTELPLISTDQGSENVDPSNALDLSESEEEEDVEVLAQDFLIQTNMDQDGTRQEQLYFFQFPEPFPTFVSASVPTPELNVNNPDQDPFTTKRKVSFAADTKSLAPESTIPEVATEAPRVDGVIGHVEVYRSGAVKMRLGNGIVLNVSEGACPSFLQQAVHLDMENKQLHVLGEVKKRFVVSPDLDVLLASMELADAASTVLDDANLIKMNSV